MYDVCIQHISLFLIFSIFLADLFIVANFATFVIFALQFLPNKGRLKYEAYTPPQTHSIKSEVFKPTFFRKKWMMKNGLDFFYFEILLAPSEMLLPSTTESAQKD